MQTHQPVLNQVYPIFFDNWHFHMIVLVIKETWQGPSLFGAEGVYDCVIFVYRISSTRDTELFILEFRKIIQLFCILYIYIHTHSYTYRYIPIFYAFWYCWTSFLFTHCFFFVIFSLCICLKIAMKELRQRKIPFTIRRYLPDGR